jgi:DNA-binding NtrC family response regulator
MKKGRFRKDLCYRINVVKFYMSPLKERKEDITLLVNHRLKKERKKGEPKKEIYQGAMKRLMTFREI